MELVLNSYGVSLSKDNEGFVISSGGSKQKIPARSINCIQIGKGTQITSDAIMLAVENEIEIIFVNRTGTPIGRIWSPKYGSISTIRKGQINFVYSNDAVAWIKDIIKKKIENQQAMVLMFKHDDDVSKRIAEKCIVRLEDYRKRCHVYQVRLSVKLPHNLEAGKDKLPEYISRH